MKAVSIHMDNPLKKIFSGSFFQNKAVESVVGIDIGTSAVKVVQLKKKQGRAVLETYGALSLGPYGNADVGAVTNLPAETLAKAVGDVLREASVTTKDAVLAIPASASLVFIISLPQSVEEADIANVVQTEARKYIPVPISEVSLDYWKMPSSEEMGLESAGDEKKDVLIVAIHNDTISKYRDIVAKAELQSDSFELETFSQIRGGFGQERSPIVLADFGAFRTKLSVVEHGIIRQFHVVNRGSQDITNALAKSLGIPFSQAEEMKKQHGLSGEGEHKNVSDTVRLTAKYVVDEINSVMLAYEKKYNKPVSKVVLSGGGSLLRGFVEMAAEQLRTDVIYADPFSKAEAPAFLAPVLASSGPEFAVAVGLALRKLQ